MSGDIGEEGRESASRLPNFRDGGAIVSKKKKSALYDESILSIGACQTRADITGCPRWEPQISHSARFYEKREPGKNRIPFLILHGAEGGI